MKKGTKKAPHLRTSKRGRKFRAGRGKRKIRRAGIEKKVKEPLSTIRLRAARERQKQYITEQYGPELVPQILGQTPEEKKIEQYQILSKKIGAGPAFKQIYDLSMYEIPYEEVKKRITPKTYKALPSFGMTNYRQKMRILAKKQAELPFESLEREQIAGEILELKKQQEEAIKEAQTPYYEKKKKSVLPW